MGLTATGPVPKSWGCFWSSVLKLLFICYVLVASRQWMQVTPEPSRRLAGDCCVSGRLRHRMGDIDSHLKSRVCTRPAGWQREGPGPECRF